MTKFTEQLTVISASDRFVWRAWLEENHATCPGVWLIYYKVKSGKPSIRYNEAVQEALCFGWIDSKVKSINQESYKQIFTPRKPQSVWSKLNKQYVEELIKLGLMREAGLQKIATAKKDGSWEKLDAVEALIIPQDLEQALALDKIAQSNFVSLSNSSKKNILSWIESAKRPETRSRRIEKTVNSVRENKNGNPAK